MSEGANEVDPSSFVVRSFVPSFLRSFVRLSFVRSFVLSFVCCRSFLPSFLPSFVWKFGPLVHFFWPLEIVGRWSLVVGRWSFGGCWLERLVIGLFVWLAVLAQHLMASLSLSLSLTIARQRPLPPHLFENMVTLRREACLRTYRTCLTTCLSLDAVCVLASLFVSVLHQHLLFTVSTSTSVHV